MPANSLIPEYLKVQIVENEEKAALLKIKVDDNFFLDNKSDFNQFQ